MVLLFKDSISEAASPNRRCSQQYLDTPHLAALRRGLARNYRKKSFAFSKKLLCIGLLSSPQEAANSSSLRRCSPFNLVGTSTMTLIRKSPLTLVSIFWTPFPRRRSSVPL